MNADYQEKALDLEEVTDFLIDSGLIDSETDFPLGDDDDFHIRQCNDISNELDQVQNGLSSNLSTVGDSEDEASKKDEHIFEELEQSQMLEDVFLDHGIFTLNDISDTKITFEEDIESNPIANQITPCKVHIPPSNNIDTLEQLKYPNESYELRFQQIFNNKLQDLLRLMKNTENSRNVLSNLSNNTLDECTLPCRPYSAVLKGGDHSKSPSMPRPLKKVSVTIPSLPAPTIDLIHNKGDGNDTPLLHQKDRKHQNRLASSNNTKDDSSQNKRRNHSASSNNTTNDSSHNKRRKSQNDNEISTDDSSYNKRRDHLASTNDNNTTNNPTHNKCRKSQNSMKNSTNDSSNKKFRKPQINNRDAMSDSSKKWHEPQSPLISKCKMILSIQIKQAI